MKGKELVGLEIAKRVKSGEILGIGTGSTVDAALDALANRIKSEGLKISCVPSSLQSAWRCQEAGIAVLYPGYRGVLDWGFDGADEVDPNLWLIKGLGGALLQEKILAKRCKKFVVIVDQSKLVNRLGERTAIPVEVVPEAYSIVEPSLLKLGAKSVEVRLAVKKHGPIITERGNILIDASFETITQDLETKIKGCVGVVESGLFIGYADEILVADGESTRSIHSKR